MVSSVSANNHIFSAARKFGKKLDFVQLINKAVSNLLSWSEYLPLPSKVLSFLADQRFQIKTVSSTFALPKFFIKQAKLCETFMLLKNRFNVAGPDRLKKIAGGAKKTFFAFLSAVKTGMKLPQLLDKTRIVDLSKISRMLPNYLAKGEYLVSAGLCGMKTVDIARKLRAQLKKENFSEKFSPKVKKTLLKLGANSAKTFSNSLAGAALFLGMYSNPIIATALSTLTIGISVISNMIGHTQFFRGDKSNGFWEASASLPA